MKYGTRVRKKGVGWIGYVGSPAANPLWVRVYWASGPHANNTHRAMLVHVNEIEVAYDPIYYPEPK